MCKNHMDWILEDVAIGNIYVGSDLDYLINNDIRAVVCALPKLPHSINIYQQKGIKVFHVPIDDHPEVPISIWFDKVSTFMLKQRLDHKKILVHCYAGISRSVSLTVAFLMNLLCCDDQTCLLWIKNKRSCANPNVGFLKELNRYYHILKQRK